jgi:hypothetical protein
MDPKPSPKYLKILLIIFAVVLVAAVSYFAYLTSKAKQATVVAIPASPTRSGTAQPTGASASPCVSPTFSAEETAILDQNISNPTYHFTYKILHEWVAAITNNDQMASFAEFPWGDESLAAINLMVIVGNEKVGQFPVGDLVEESSRTVSIDCINATYKVYQKTHNDRWDKDEYHIRTTFSKDGVPYLIILNYPFQGASADGDTVDAYNSFLKTIDFE